MRWKEGTPDPEEGMLFMAFYDEVEGKWFSAYGHSRSFGAPYTHWAVPEMPKPRLNTEEINALIEEAKVIAPLKTEWVHKGGGEYYVLGYALDTDAVILRVQYRRIGGLEYDPDAEANIVFSRPLDEWTEDRFTRK